MPQGKFKAKPKLPSGVKAKSKSKGNAFTRRARAPIQPKKSKFAEQQKLKHVVTKNVNKSMEEEIRAVAKESQLNLSNAQKAVAKHQKEKVVAATTNTKTDNDK